MIVGGGMDELQRLEVEAKDLQQRVSFYQGRYYSIVAINKIEHYR